MFWLSCRMLQGKANSELLKSIQSQLNKFCHPQMAWKAQRKVNITKGVDWSFQKCTFENDGLFYLYSKSIFFKQPFLWERGKVWAKFVMTSSSCCCCCCFYSIKQNLVFANFIGREHLNFSLYLASKSLPFLRSQT